MTEAAAWAASGAPHGALVVAERQTAGRGRHGRAWTDAPGQSLLFSLVLRPTLPPDRLGLVPLAAGLAVAEAAETFGVRASVKWPNDVRVDGQKLAGVLTEATWAGVASTVILGIGVNVGQAAFPEPLADLATSLRLANGQPVERLAPLTPILARLGVRLAEAEDKPGALIQAVEARMEGVGEPVTVGFPDRARTPLSGDLLGLAPDGALRLRTEVGEKAVHAGEVTLSPALP